MIRFLWATWQNPGRWSGQSRTNLPIAVLVLGFSFAGGSNSFAQTPFAPWLDKVTELDLKYRVIGTIADRPRCEPHLSILAESARKTFPQIKRDAVTYHAICQHLGLRETAKFSDDEKLLVYRDYRNLNRVHLAPQGDRYRVTFGAPLDCGRYASGRETFLDRQGTVGESAESVDHDVSPPLRELRARPPAPSPPTPVEKISLPDLRYRLLGQFGQVAVCGAPVIRADERRRQIHAFSQIEQDSATMAAILRHLRWEGGQGLSDEQKLVIYQEYESLRAPDLEPLASKYEFSMNVLVPRRTRTGFGKSGDRIYGLIDRQGRISVLRRDPIVLACPK
jgi:hypothetical protein